MSPSALARRTGLHPATMTGILDRLQRAGWVARERDPNAADRRAVTVRVLRERGGELFRHYAGMNSSLDGICAGYTDAELTVLVDFLRRATEAGAPRRTRSARDCRRSRACPSVASSAARARRRHSSRVTPASASRTAGIARGDIDRLLTPRPTSTGASVGSEAASPQTPTGLPTARPASPQAAMSDSSAGCHGSSSSARVATHPVGGEGVLAQVVGTDAEEVHFGEQRGGAERGRRDLDHDPYSGQSSGTTPGGELPRLRGRGHHRSHHSDVGSSRRPLPRRWPRAGHAGPQAVAVRAGAHVPPARGLARPPGSGTPAACPRQHPMSAPPPVDRQPHRTRHGMRQPVPPRSAPSLGRDRGARYGTGRRPRHRRHPHR